MDLLVLMKRSILALFCIALSSAAVSARAQVVPSATGSTFTLTAGGVGSAFQPDYAGEGVAQDSPNRLYGIGAYADVHFSRWEQLEGEARWLSYNKQVTKTVENGENSYSIGPRIAPYTFHKLTPYGKVLVGIGSANFLTGRCFALTYGGGVDYRLFCRVTARGDFEFQQWYVTPTLHPYGASVGISYRILPWR